MAAPRNDYTALGVKVEALDTDIREVKDSLLGLDAKIENAVTGLAREVRSAVESLRAQFAERQRTPWVAISGVAAVLVTIAGFIANQALTPIAADIKYLKEQSFPKEEAIFRYGINDQRLTALEKRFDLLQDRRYQELNEQLTRLRKFKDEHQPK